MDPLTGVHVTAAGLLALGGALKFARPSPATRALRSLHVPVRPTMVRLLGVVEVVVALCVLVRGGMLPFSAQAACYLAFVLVAFAFWHRGELPSCGCFGEVESPPSLVHVLVTAAGFGVSLRGALVGAGAPWHEPVAVVAGLAALGLVYLLLVDLPRLFAAVRLHAGGSPA